MNDHHNLPPRHQLARPSRELDRRIEALLAAGVVRSEPSSSVRRTWLLWFAPAGLAAAAALFLLQPRSQTIGPPVSASIETRELSANLAAELLPPEPVNNDFCVSILSY